MTSPFPGMDPYLEAYWGDVHTSLITYARDQLRAQMPGNLRVRVEEHVTVQIADDEDGEPREGRGYYPDVRVLEHFGNTSEQPVQSPAAGTAVLADPLVVPLELEAQTQRSIRIIDTSSGNRVVTAIEFLNPANKVGHQGRAGQVNLVEIDLLREGGYMMAAPAHLVPLPYLAPYRVCVIRGYRPNQAEVYRVSLQERLPVIRVPLREKDPDARLDLQELIGKSYENGGYGADIDYRVDPRPALQGDDAAWADTLLHEKGRR